MTRSIRPSSRAPAGGPRNAGEPAPGGRPSLPPTQPFSWKAWVFLALLLGGMAIWQSANQEQAYPAIDYSEFFQLVEQQKVASITWKGDTVIGELKKPETRQNQSFERFQTVLPEADTELLPVLRKNGVNVKVRSQEAPLPLQIAGALLPWVLIIGVWIWLSRRAQQMMVGGGPLAGVLKGRSRRFDKQSAVSISFKDVAGLRAAKQDLKEVVAFLKAPEKFRRLGSKVPRGVLLVGPPGTGKTLLARAVAGEAGVAFFSISASEFIEMFVGVGASRVRELFAEAKKSAPAIIFIDEIDAVGRSRGAGLGGGNDEREQTLNQLLSEMDGFDRSDLTVVLAATNRPDVLDPALLRPGRFDRRVLVDRPELEARRAILDVHVRDKPLGPDVDLQQIARDTPGFSGADLANLVNEAALGATRNEADYIAQRDFDAAYEKIVLGDPREGKLQAAERRRVAVHESGHAVIMHFSPHAEPLRRVSILPRGMALGVTQQTAPEDRHILTQPELEAQLRVLLGGYAAERSVLGNISSGAADDLKRATEIAFKMVAHYGMSEKVGPVFHEHKVEHPFLGQRLATEGGTSDVTVRQMEDEVRSLLVHAQREAERQLGEHRPALDRLVEALLEKETLETEALRALLGPSVRDEREAPESGVLH
ncbi:MAG TPA: ATP-dependent zinc metalloprotease FtsH [Polyangiaceae bacterium]|nr:ATP-dependent zinc metalloprotease FtsH [Polyangiaceae bacterium]